MGIPVVGPLFSAAGGWAAAHLGTSPVKAERRPVAPATEESVVFAHYLYRDAEERAAYRRLRERQVEPVLEFLALCGERLAAQVNRDFLLEVYERSTLLQAGLTRGAFYAEVTPTLVDRGWMQTLLQTFFRASATAPTDEVRTLIRRVWEEMMTSNYAAATVLQTLDQARQALLDYVVRGQEIGAITLACSTEGERAVPVTP